jgi:hypothetical protein
MQLVPLLRRGVERQEAEPAADVQGARGQAGRRRREGAQRAGRRGDDTRAPPQAHGGAVNKEPQTLNPKH